MDQPGKLNTDILIIGQGLSGSLLAYELEQRKIDFLICDNGWRNASSIAAAGLINPVTGQRLVKTRQIETLLPKALSTYGALEERLERQLHHPRPMLRLLQQPKELGQLEKRRRMADYQPFLGDYLTSAQTPPNIQAPLGSLEQYQAGFVDLPTLLAGLKTHFKQTGQYRMGEYPINRLKFTHSAIQWGDIRAQRVVFCEGYRGKDNPWFKHLPFQPVKGEILTLELDGAPIHQILNAGPWLIPIGGNHYRLGSTHEHHRLDETSTEKGKAQLIKGLGQLLKEIPHYRILDHRAGVRPATLGTDPFLGPHPQQPRLHIFNGFGAKGSLLIPWHACRYADYLAGAIDRLPDHAHIARFIS